MNLEIYRDELKKRVATCVAFIVLVLLFVVVGNLFLKSITRTNDLVYGFAMGFAIGVLLICIFQLSNLRKALKDESLLKTMYIEEHDEREQLIELKSGKLIISRLALILIIIAIPVGFISEAVFHTLVIVAVAETLIAIALMSYWKRRV